MEDGGNGCVVQGSTLTSSLSSLLSRGVVVAQSVAEPDKRKGVVRCQRWVIWELVGGGGGGLSRVRDPKPVDQMVRIWGRIERWQIWCQQAT